MSNLQFYLEKANEYMEKAIDSEQKDKLRDAKQYYLLSAEHLFKSAKESTGKLKEIRIENAEKLLNKANSIKIFSKPIREETIAKGEKKGEDDLMEWIPEKPPNVKFDDVAGLEDAKEEIKMKLILPFKFPEDAKKYGIKSGGGILLYGPPGTGKTLIAKAVANEVDALFFSIKPSEVMSQWVGIAEKNIAKLFDTARNCKKAVIFIDEVESLIPKRHGTYSTVMKRVVPQILAELEGFESRNENLLFIGATNEPWDIDEAALRPGRFDEKIYIPPPNKEGRKKIFELNLKNKPLSENIDLQKMAEMTEGYSGADIRQICLKAGQIPFKEKIEKGIERKIEMQDLISSLEIVKPSINKNMIERFEKFAEKR